MRNRRMYNSIAKVSFWLTVAVVFIALIVVPGLFGGIWFVLYIITIPIAWNYGKYLKDNYDKIYKEPN